MMMYEISDHRLAELMSHRENYKKDNKFTKPRNFDTERNYDEYMFFLKATDDELLERYGK